MSVAISLGAETYLPLRAVPIITSGLLNTPTLADMISNPDGYCDSEHDTILGVYKFRASASPIPVHYLSFAALRSKSSRESPIVSSRHLPAGMLVRRSAVRDLFDLVVNEVGRAQPGRIKPAQTIWDEDPQLSASDYAFTFEGLSRPRMNSATQLRANILQVITDVEYRIGKSGIQIDRTKMPGTREAWSQLIWELDARLIRSPDTYKDHFKIMGIRWMAGSRRAQINPIRTALNLPAI